ncbi:hypothetical protein ACSBR1_001995 [Camellia fascicularis]
MGEVTVVDNFSSWPHALMFVVEQVKNDPLKALQDLPNLVFLSLIHKAYEGEGLCFKAGRFHRLEYLRLKSLKELRSLTMEECTMSRLEELIIMNCELLEEFP